MPDSSERDMPTTAAHHARDKRRALVRALAFGALAVLLNVAAYYLLPPDLVRRLGAFSYLGVFLITLLANATTIVPTPYIPIVACMAAQSDNLPLLIVAGALGARRIGGLLHRPLGPRHVRGDALLPVGSPPAPTPLARIRGAVCALGPA